jgi:hypothetical protein
MSEPPRPSPFPPPSTQTRLLPESGADVGYGWPEWSPEWPTLNDFLPGWNWPRPAFLPRWVVPAALANGLLAAVLVPRTPQPGIGLTISGLAVALTLAIAVHRHGRRTERAWPLGRVRFVLALIAAGLVVVPAVRVSAWLVWTCAIGAFVLEAAVVTDARRWKSLASAGAVVVVAVLPALPWAWSGVGVQSTDLRRASWPWVKGLAVGAAGMVVVGSLLASADNAFKAVTDRLWSSADLSHVPGRLLTFVIVAVAVLGAIFAASTRLAEHGGQAPATSSARHPGEWVPPLALVALTIAAFLGVEATMLFGGADVVDRLGSVSHAERARQGFGQLTVVTMIVLGLLAWAGSRAAGGPASHRRLMALAGGTLLGLTLLLAASAMRRLWFYEEAYGWTVTRLNAGVLEVGLVVVMIALAVAFVTRCTDLMPRLVVAIAGLGLLLLGLAGPDAVVASANVHRYQHMQQIDLSYLAKLSADAAPALSHLPEPLHQCLLSLHAATQAHPTCPMTYVSR